MHSLFEEQIVREQVATFAHTEPHGDSFAEALTYFPSPEAFALGPDEYLEQIRRIKEAVGVPVIASLNGYTPGGWLRLRPAHRAGRRRRPRAERLPARDEPRRGRPRHRGPHGRRWSQAVRSAVQIPVAVKLSPFYTSLAHFARRLDEAGADGLVLFNRFYQPDIDVEELQVRRALHLSTSSELPLRLRWLAILSGRCARRSP